MHHTTHLTSNRHTLKSKLCDELDYNQIFIEGSATVSTLLSGRCLVKTYRHFCLTEPDVFLEATIFSGKDVIRGFRSWSYSPARPANNPQAICLFSSVSVERSKRLQRRASARSHLRIRFRTLILRRKPRRRRLTRARRQLLHANCSARLPT